MSQFQLPITPFMPLPPKTVLAKQPIDDCYRAFLDSCELLASGRGAILRALALAEFDGLLWLPEYFCPAIKKLLAANFHIAYYHDLPSENSPRFDTLKPNRGDAVLAVNFFGLRNRDDWQKWRQANPFVVFIEDHSHAPFSDWAMSSNADFAFASLRKYLPLPDGAYLMSKNISPSKMYRAGGTIADFASCALSAQALARCDYLSALPLYYASEAKLNAHKLSSRISAYSRQILKLIDISKLSELRADAYGAFVANLADGFREVFCDNKKNYNCRDIFAPTLIFENQSLRDKVYANLRARDIFAVIYWGGQGAEISAISREEESTIFTIPLDFRHSIDECAELAKSIKIS